MSKRATNPDAMTEALGRWLRHERAGDEARAEAALGKLLSGLPAPQVPHGFASRVLAASGIEFAPRRRLARVPDWVWQTAFGVWLVSGFLVAVGAGGFAVDLARSGQAVDLLTRLVVALSRFGADLLTVLGGLVRAGAAISNAFSGPGTLVLVLACALASLAALGALQPLLSSERSRHVESY